MSSRAGGVPGERSWGWCLLLPPRDLGLAKERDASAFMTIGGVLGDQLINVRTMLPVNKAKDLQCLLNTVLFPVNQTPC